MARLDRCHSGRRQSMVTTDIRYDRLQDRQLMDRGWVVECTGCTSLNLDRNGSIQAKRIKNNDDDDVIYSHRSCTLYIFIVVM